MTQVVLRGVTKRFGAAVAADHVDLTAPSGAFFVLVGPSGCGKSTLLRLIAGLEQPDAGEIRIGGEDVTRLPPAKRGVAMVFQSYALYPHMTVYRNMAFGLKLARAHDVDAKVRQAAELLQLTPLLDRLPRELSGGQRQRVAIGRAIVREPKVFLFDEPLSNLDAALRVQTRVEIAALHRRLGTTTIYVTHDQAEAMTLADRMAVLDRGRVAQTGPPLDLYHAPANRFVAGFIGSPAMNFLDAEAADKDEGHLTVRLADGTIVPTRAPAAAATRGQSLTLGIRPEHLRLCAPDGGSAFEVALVENLGDAHLLHLTGPAAGRLVVRGPGTARHSAGDRLGLAIDPAATHLFDRDGAALARGPGTLSDLLEPFDPSS